MHKKSSKRLLIGTHNPGKLQKIQEHLANLPYTLVSLTELGIEEIAPETGSTLEENARQKALFYAQLTGLPVLVDDSGLFIDALQGEPGVHTAHYAGADAPPEQHVALVLAQMAQIPWEQRIASFKTVIAFKDPQGSLQTFTGTLAGYITQQPQGEFSPSLPYRQIFYLPEYGKTLAELPHHAATHRTQALELCLAYLRSFSL